MPPLRTVSTLGGLALLALLAGASGFVHAQAASPTTAEALRLRDSGDLAGAVRVLRDRLTARPDDGDAARLLAQTLYWLGERDEARRTYEDALLRHPNDTAVRLDYGRMLVDLMNASRARSLLRPLASGGNARAATLLGTLDYWLGDLTGATAWFRTALDADSTEHEARRLWREIAVQTSPWVRLAVAERRDDQPLRRLGADVEAGWYPVPNWSLAVRAAPARFPKGAASVREAVEGTARVQGRLPALRLALEGEGGVQQRSWGRSSDGVWRVAGTLRPGGPWSLGVDAGREAYLHTVRSLDTAVISTTVAGRLHLDHRGWLGEAAARREHFPDDNAINAAYAWLLAPLVRTSGGMLQAGYAFSAQDAQRTRFSRVDATSPPGQRPPDLRGRYDPYFTPDNLVSHAAVAALVLRPSSSTAVRFGGSYGLHTRDRAPVFVADSTGPPPVWTVHLTSYERRYSPWDVRGSLEGWWPGGSLVRVSATHQRTVFYAASSVQLEVVIRMAGRALRRVDTH